MMKFRQSWHGGTVLPDSGERVLRNALVQTKHAEVMLYEMEQRALDAGWTRDALGLVSPDGKSRLDR